MRNYKWLAAILLIPLVMSACSNERVNEAEIGVHYTEGWIEGRHFETVLEPGDSQWVWNDNVYKLPARQVTWVSGPGWEDGNSDVPAITFTAQGGERLVMELSTRFFINTTLNDDQEPFKTFFTSICQKYDCWEGAIGGTDPDDGWIRMLRDIVGNPQQAAANSLGLEFNAEELRYDNAVREEFADQFAEEFERLLSEEIGVANIFCGLGYERGEEACPPVSVKVTNVRFENEERESIREEQRLAEEQQELAVQQEEAARAQQRVNQAKATPEYRALAEADALKACATNPECRLTIIVGQDDIQSSIPVG